MDLCKKIITVFSVSVFNVKLEKGDKSITFYGGQVLGEIAIDSTAKNW